MAKYDVVIVGAGPAGLKAAELLAKNNKKVLVLEKNKVVGPKVCAAGITTKDLKYIPKDILERKFDSVVFVSKKRKKVKHLLFTTKRETLGKYQLKIAKKAGAIIKTNSLVKKIKKNSIIADKEYYFDYLIGADGSDSVVRRHLKLKTEQIALAIQYKIKKHYKDIEFHFDTKKYGPWYAWIFPHKDFTSIGTGATINNTKNLRKKLDDFAKKNNFNIKNAKFEAALINADYQGYKFDNIFLAGDAAGLANPITGEGIYQALASGEEVARKILDINYNCKKIKNIGEKNRKLIKLLDIMDKYPFLLHFFYWFGLKLLSFGFMSNLLRKHLT
jgi:geranylgeranyl reductase